MLDATGTPRETIEDGDEEICPPGTPVSCAAGVVALLLACFTSSIWITWWLFQVGPAPIPIALIAFDIVGLVAGIGVAVGLLRARYPLTPEPGGDRAFRYLEVVARGHAVEQADNVRSQLRMAVRKAALGEPTRSRDAALWGAVADGPRRIGQIAAISLGLLVGTRPFPMPPTWALVSLVAGLISMSAAHTLLSGGAIRPGDRTRWAFASMGEALAFADDNELAPRRWVGVIGAAVTLCLAIGLRGVSDRWTHGLPPMDRDDRVALMAAGIVLLVGALATLTLMSEPNPRNSHLVARRLEERTARQLVLGGAVCLGMVGFLAGVLPVPVDVAQDDVGWLIELPGPDDGVGVRVVVGGG